RRRHVRLRPGRAARRPAGRASARLRAARRRAAAGAVPRRPEGPGPAREAAAGRHRARDRGDHRPQSDVALPVPARQSTEEGCAGAGRRGRHRGDPVMRLTEISAVRLKSLRDLRLEVGPLVALAGPNGSGKTAILQAVRLAILGYEPSVGKTLGATKTLYGDGRMASVGLVFDDGFTIARGFSDSIATNVMPLRGESTERQRQARIEAETGAFLPSFDFEAFLGL